VVENTQVGADDSEWDEDLVDKKGALRKGAEDGDKALDTVKGEGGYRGDVAGAEEGGLEEEVEKERDAGIREF
jgi:hypothetical protein